MKIERLDHVHIHVNDLEKAMSVLKDMLGTEFAVIEGDTAILDRTAEYGARIAWHPIGLELIQATHHSQKIGDLPQEGVLAIDFKVPNLEEAVAEMESKGWKTVLRFDNDPVKEALMRHASIVGLRIELSEYPGDNITSAFTD